MTAGGGESWVYAFSVMDIAGGVQGDGLKGQ